MDTALSSEKKNDSYLLTYCIAVRRSHFTTNQLQINQFLIMRGNAISCLVHGRFGASLGVVTEVLGTLLLGLLARPMDRTL